MRSWLVVTGVRRHGHAHATSAKRRPIRPQQQLRRTYKSLAFTTLFKQEEDLGMTDYEILSRGTASLLSVDPRPTAQKDGPYAHLEVADQQRKLRDFKRDKGYTPPIDGSSDVTKMGWLQFVPKEHRPNYHVMASSHVASPFLWLDYYPHDWLTQITQEHCQYRLEVIDTDNLRGPPLASFALHNSPIHHPEGRDVAFLHLQDEEEAVKTMKKMGVQFLYMRDPEKLFSKGETIHFDGYIVHDPDDDDGESVEDMSTDEDTRIFEPYAEVGQLSSHTHDRFFATTETPLPEGLCGAPALDADGDLCGVVEGIVPVDHANAQLAGQAAFLPSFLLEVFVEYAERFMTEQLTPKEIFQSIVRAKTTGTLGGGTFKLNRDGTPAEGDASWEEAYERQLEILKKKYSKEEVDAILWNVKREREEVVRIMNEEGGELDEVIQRVRAQTYAMRQHALNEYKKEQEGGGGEGSGDNNTERK